MKYNIRLSFILLFLILLLNISSNLVYAYNNIDYLNIDVEVYPNALNKFNYTFVVNGLEENNSVLYLDFEDVNFRKLSISVNNKSVFDYKYLEADNLVSIDLSYFDLSESNIIELSFYSDSYTFKNSDNWYIEFRPLFSESVDELSFMVSKDLKVIGNYSTVDSISWGDDFISLIYYNVSYIKFNYRNNYYTSQNKFVQIFRNTLNLSNLQAIIFWIISILLIIVLIFYIFKVKNKFKLKSPNFKKSLKSFDNSLLLGLNENEQKIIKIVLNENGVSQKVIALKSFLPKGTVSRNIKKLESKGYIIIKPYGATNKIFLGEIFNK